MGKPIRKNGAIVNVQPPGYTNPQSQDNDSASSYIYVEAFDNGDAPASYLTAAHTVDVTKDPDTGRYNQYMYLGSEVDPETIFSRPLMPRAMTTIRRAVSVPTTSRG